MKTHASVILLDIEGTTTPIDFVYETLFPYARARVESFLAEHVSDEETQADIAGLVDEHARDARLGLDPPALEDQSDEARLRSIAAYVEWLMDQDRKSTPLKSLQGRIWEAGYIAGELKSQVYDDVPPAMARWHGRRKDICIYSSGSVLAQKLLFAHTEAGDLTAFIRDYFDTKVGAKREAESYLRIASLLDRAPRDIVFVSDVTAELDAARAAEFQTLLCERPGNHPQPVSSHAVIRTFDALIA
ncbi:MAG TPA: acireductone synthase [Blastocatellia bacterium]|nr:acireductone synthase [Blastocatellia bacterium]